MKACFRTSDGCRLGYVDEGTGTPVLWQHGLGATQAQVAEVFPATSHLRRITLECRGHADSELGTPDALTIPRFAEDAIELLDYLGVGRAVVGGISMGAAIALRLAVRHPQRVRAVVVARPAWIDETVPERLAIYADVAVLLAQLGPVQGLRSLESSRRYRMLLNESPDNAASMRGFFTRNPATTVALLGRIPLQGSGVSRDGLSRLALPALVIANEGDYVHSISMATEIAALIPGATLRIIPAKNAAWGGYVEAFRAALEEFLSDEHPG